MIVYALRSKLVRPRTRIIDTLAESIRKRGLSLKNKDIVAVSSKVVAISEGRVRELSSVEPSEEARALAQRYALSPEFAQIVLDESDEILGGVKGFLLTTRNGDATANAGVDKKNAPPGSVVLWPQNPDSSARRLRQSLYQRYRKRAGVVIVDSRVAPLRIGTVGFAIGCSGIEPLRDLRGSLDVHDRRVRVTRHAIADSIAGAAQLLMGEANEQTPFIIVRGAPAVFGRSGISRTRLVLKDCLYLNGIPHPR
ncbi:MAG TPA: coenzyme F420-0:L-glutamate ligase [Candidatus Bathyarchaeia archaeon]|nr:coenzyme F420-0:L-glutamate ligase [Candidatus Bathyarchaeia archaeon]